MSTCCYAVDERSFTGIWCMQAVKHTPTMWRQSNST